MMMVAMMADRMEIVMAIHWVDSKVKHLVAQKENQKAGHWDMTMAAW
jgi:hypothetical protein